MRRTTTVFAAAALLAATVTTGIAHARAHASTGVTWCDNPAGGIAIVGDSLSTGYYPPTAPPSEVVAPDQTWFAKLANKENIQRGAKTQMYANNGAMAWDYTDPAGRWPHETDPIAQQQPSLVLIELGANEYHSAIRNPQQFRTDLQNLYTKIHAESPRSTIGWIAIYQLQDTGAATVPWKSYVDQIFNAALVDLGPEFDLTWYFPALGAPDSLHQLSSVDHIHPTPVGENDVFTMIDQAINRTCGWS